MNPPRTIHVYLHPPLSERVVLLCPDFRVADLELSEKKGHTGQSASGFLILHGEDMQAPDHHTVTFSPVQGGLPVYCLNSVPENGTRLSMETFSSFDRVPVTYARVTVTNNNNYAVRDALGLLPRSNDADSYTFGGWFKDADCEESWDFENDTVTEDVTLYALWFDNAVDATVAATDDIGDVELKEAVKDRIDLARELYDELTEEQQALVVNYDVLLAAEEEYAKLAAAAAITAAQYNNFEAMTKMMFGNYSFALNGGKLNSRPILPYGVAINQKSLVPTRAGYTFDG